MGKKSNQMMVRLDDDSYGLLDGLAQRLEIPAAALARAAVLNMLQEFKHTGVLAFPASAISKPPAGHTFASASLAGIPLERHVAEEQSAYQHGPGKGGATTPAKPPNKSSRHRGDGPRVKVS